MSIAAHQSAEAAQVATVLVVPGMHCAGCMAKVERALAALDGVKPFPSEANMILVRVADSARAFEGMKRRGVLIKHIAGLHPLLANCLRLTVGTPEENTLMIDALKASL